MSYCGKIYLLNVSKLVNFFSAVIPWRWFPFKNRERHPNKKKNQRLELEEKKKLLEEKKAKKAEEIKSRRELILKQKDEKREAYLKKRDSLLKLRRKK